MISTFRITNFKCFRDQSLRLKTLTILAGANATGKSSVIQALLLLRQGWEKKDFEGKRLSLTGDWVSVGQAKDAIHDKGSDEIGFELQDSESSTAQLFKFSYSPGEEERHFLTALALGATTGNLFAPRFDYLCAERLGPRLTYPITDYGMEPSGVGIHGEFAFHCLQRFGDVAIATPSLAWDENQSLALMHQTQLWMRLIAPELQIETVGVSGADLVRVGYRNRGATAAYRRPSNMGFGISYLLPIVVAILTARKGSLIIIENPEAHLHPGAQSKIAALFARAASSGVQLLIETHSDHLLNGIRLAVKGGGLDPEAIAFQFFKRDPESGETVVESPKIDKNGRLKPWPDGFFDQAEKDLLDLI